MGACNCMKDKQDKSAEIGTDAEKLMNKADKGMQSDFVLTTYTISVFPQTRQQEVKRKIRIIRNSNTQTSIPDTLTQIQAI